MYGTPLVYSKITSNQQTVTVSGIPNTYKHLMMIWTARTTDTQYGPQTRWTWNNTQISNGSNWTMFGAENNNSVDLQAYGPEGDFRQRAITRDDVSTNLFAIYRCIIPNYSTTSVTKALLIPDYHATFGQSSPQPTSTLVIANCLNTTATLSNIVFSTNQGPYKTGCTFAIYGLAV